MNSTLLPISQNLDNTSQNLDNTSLPWACPQEYYSEDIKMRIITTQLCLGIEFILAVISNSCLMIFLWKRRENWSRMHLFILHLGFADFMVAFFFILPQWMEYMACGFYLPDGICRLYRYMLMFPTYGSTFILLAVARDRYNAICNPMEVLGKSRKYIHITAALMWLLAACIAVPQMIIFRKTDEKNCLSELGEYCPACEKAYVIWFALAVLIIPTLALFYLYGSIYMHIKRNMISKKRAIDRSKASSEELQALSKVKKRSQAPRSSSMVGITRAKVKTAKMTFVIVATYFGCWTPYFVTQLLFAWGVKLNGLSTPASAIFNMMLMVGSFTSCTNPWIFICFSGKFRYNLKELFCFGKKNKEDRFPSSSTANGARLPRKEAKTNAENTTTTTTTCFTVDSPTAFRRIQNGFAVTT